MPGADPPFLEHPTGEHSTALDAIVSAMERLAALPCWDRWITFSGQGAGARADAIHIVDVRVLHETLDVGAHSFDLPAVLRAAGLDALRPKIPVREGRIELRGATPQQVGVFVDALFRVGLGIRPFPGEEDYAVGAEW
ncbi:MAG: hypothetical protein L0216_03905 [Planctomycetales bacterium]|nr:hypothetical protein [Planctomycetales bacterium]